MDEHTSVDQEGEHVAHPPSRGAVVDVPDAGSTLLDASVGIAYEDGSARYTAVFGSESGGDPVVTLITGESTGTSYTLTGTGGGYHLYESSVIGS